MQNIYYTIQPSSLGSVLVATSEKGICAITLGDDRDALVQDLQRRFPRAEICDADEHCTKAATAVVEFAEKPTRDFAIPLDIQGTPFQQQVWNTLRKIPLGKTATYGEIARTIGRPTAMRAVAQACGANHIAVVIPCHRVIRTDGSLSGYRWGVERKAKLLQQEKLPSL